jgi:O-antigen/teichoic acid export membrane protein
MAINKSVMVQLSDHIQSGDKEALQAMVKKCSVVIAAVCFPVVVLLLVFGHFILGLYGAGFLGAYTSLVILLCGAIVNVSMGSVGIMMVMAHCEKKSVRIVLLSLVFNLIVGCLLSQKYGAVGVSVGVAVSIIIQNIIMWAYIKKKLGINASVFCLATEVSK